MKVLYSCLLFLLFQFSCGSLPVPEGNKSLILYSDAIKDSFHISISFPLSYKKDQQLRVLIIPDGSLKFGQLFQKEFESSKNKDLVLVRISHLGSWKDKRRRDFIPSDSSKNDEVNFGQAAAFYSFLKDTVIQRIREEIPNGKDYYFAGHSFGGLFSLYCLLQKDTVFKKVYAVSPSCWANYYELSKIKASTKMQSTPVQIYVGGLEVFNKVKSSTEEYLLQIRKDSSASEQVRYEILSGKNHFSILQPAVHKIFEDIINLY
jgi:predicted alpha/beta superfamily hydrolase